MLDLLIPRRCVFCGTLCIDDEQAVCAACIDDLPWNPAPVSPSPGVLACCVAPLLYAFPVDAAIKTFKFNRKLFYAPAFVELLCRVLPLLPEDIDGVLPVPLHWRRKARRGFNQAEEIAKPVAGRLATPVVRGVVRRRATPFQSGLGAEQRASNLRRAFRVKRKLAYEHVLLLDDVITTGATMDALARCLLEHGIGRVSALVVAKA